MIDTTHWLLDVYIRHFGDEPEDHIRGIEELA